jgi:hypothetical protein
MTISVWGWGSTAISTWGWGASYYEYIPKILASFMESPAYSCVLNRDYIEVLSRDTGIVVYRVKPEEIPARERGEILQRIATNVSERSGGWPWQSEPCE